MKSREIPCKRNFCNRSGYRIRKTCIRIVLLSLFVARFGQAISDPQGRKSIIVLNLHTKGKRLISGNIYIFPRFKNDDGRIFVGNDLNPVLDRIAVPQMFFIGKCKPIVRIFMNNERNGKIVAMDHKGGFTAVAEFHESLSEHFACSTGERNASAGRCADISRKFFLRTFRQLCIGRVIEPQMKRTNKRTIDYCQCIMLTFNIAAANIVFGRCANTFKGRLENSCRPFLNRPFLGLFLVFQTADEFQFFRDLNK